MAAAVEVVTRLSGVESVRTGLSALSASIEGISKAATGVGRALSIGVTAPIVAMGYAVAHAFMEQESALAQLKSALKSTEGAAGVTLQQLNKMSLDLQKASSFSGDEITRMQARFLTFREISGSTFERASKSAVDLAARMGTDLTTAAFQLGRALESPEHGMMGLRRAGILFTEQQQLMIKGLVETGRESEAQAIILAEVERRAGGAAAAMRNTLAGSLGALKNATSNLLESIGEAGLGLVLRSLTEGAINLTKAFNQLTPQAKLAGTIIAGAFAVVGPIFIALGSAIRIVTFAFTGFVAVASGVVSAVKAIIAVTLALRTALLSVTSMPVVIAAGIATLIASGYLLISNWEKVKEVANTTWSEIKITILNWIREIVDTFDTQLLRLMGLGPALEELKTKLSGIIDSSVQQRVAEGGQGLSEALDDVWGGVMTNLEGVGERVAQMFSKTFDAASKAVHTSTEGITSNLDTVTSKVRELTVAQKQLLRETLDFEIAIGQKSLEARLSGLEKERDAAVRGSSDELTMRKQLAQTQLDIFHREEELAQKRFNNNEVLMQEWLANQKARFEEMGETGGLVVEEIKRKTQDLGFASIDAAGVMHRAFSTTFSSLARGGKSFSDQIKGFFSSISDSIISEMSRVLANKAVAALFGGAVGAGTGSLFGGLFGGGGGTSGSMVLGTEVAAGGMVQSGGLGGGFFSSIGSFFGFHRGGVVGAGGGIIRVAHPALFANAPRLHDGGLMPGEVPAILQKGEEVLPANSPRHRNNFESGGIQVNQTLQISAGVSPTVRAEIMAMMPQILKATTTAVADGARRGGDFRKAFR